MGRNSLRDFLIRKAGRQWDSFVCEGATLQDIDEQAVDYFLRRAIAAGRMPRQALGDNVANVLGNLDLITEDYRLRNAAILLFGKRPQHFFISARFRIGRFIADDTDLVRQDVIEGNILQMADEVMWKMRTDYLTAPIHYEGMQRIETLEIPEAALREIVYNALIHRDYLGADTQMKVYNDHIWCWNEGELPPGFNTEQTLTEHISKPRNRLIANVFFKAGFVESWGRGISMVCRAFKEAGLSYPSFESAWGGTLVVIPRPNTGAPQNAPQKLTERQYLILDFASRNPQMSKRRMAESLGVSYDVLKRELSSMSSYIRHIGPAKGGHWEIISPPDKP